MNMYQLKTILLKISVVKIITPKQHWSGVKTQRVQRRSIKCYIQLTKFKR